MFGSSSSHFFESSVNCTSTQLLLALCPPPPPLIAVALSILLELQKQTHRTAQCPNPAKVSLCFTTRRVKDQSQLKASPIPSHSRSQTCTAVHKHAGISSRHISRERAQFPLFPESCATYRAAVFCCWFCIPNLVPKKNEPKETTKHPFLSCVCGSSCIMMCGCGNPFFAGEA